MPIIMDRESMRNKVSRMLLKQLSSKIEEKLTPITKLKLEISFAHDGITYFILFCMVNVIKNRNDFFRKGNDFCYPKLTLSSSFALETGA